MALIVGAYTNTPPQSDVTKLTLGQWTGLKAAVSTPAHLNVRRVFAPGVPTNISAYMSDSSGFTSHGITPFASCKPSFTNVGSDNAKITSLAASMPSGSYLTCWHEPENDMTAAQYVAVFRNFYATAKAANPNIYVGNIYMTYQWGTEPGRKVTNPDAWWVGANFTDFLFTDTYMDTFQKDGSGNPKTLDVDPDHQRWHNWAVTKGKPLGVTESGVGQGFTDAQRAAYYTNSVAWLISKGYRMWLPWNGLGTPPNGESWDFSGGARSWPLTLAAYNTILTAGQSDAVLTPAGGVTSGYVGSTSVQGNPTASLALTLPTGIQAGDALMLWVAWVSPVSNVATTMTPPAGWTNLGTTTATVSGSNGLKAQLLKRSALTSDNGATITVKVSQRCKVAAVACAYRGTDASSVNAVAFGADPTTSAITTHGPTPTMSLQTSAPILEFFAGKSATNASYTVPSGTSKRAEVYGVGTAVDALLLESSTTVTSGGGHTTTAGTASAYEVYVTVGLSAVTTVVTYPPPSVADAVVTADPSDPETLTLTLSASGSDPAGGMLSYTVDWGDGSPVSTGPPYTHTYSTPDTYTLKITATSSVSALTSDVHLQQVVAAAGGGQEPNRGYWEPAPGTPLVQFGSGLRSAIEAIGADMAAALGNTTSGPVARSQDSLLRGWLLSTIDPTVCGGTVALTAGNLYRYRTLCRSDGAATALDLYVTTILSGSGIVFSIRDQDGNLITSQTADSVLGSTGPASLTFTTTPVSRSSEYVLSLYVPSGASVTLAGSAIAADLTNTGSALTGLIAAVSSASSNVDPLDVTAGSAASLPMLALR